MWIGWYLNHSGSPNSDEREEECYYAVRDIAAGEEITIDYKKFNEPDAKKDAFYAKARTASVAPPPFMVESSAGHHLLAPGDHPLQ
jgi:hypothetical protein